MLITRCLSAARFMRKLQRQESVRQCSNKCKLDPSSLRFIQFKRESQNGPRLGLSTADGTMFTDLTSQCLFPQRMVTFLKSTRCFSALLNNDREGECQWEPVSDAIELLPPIIDSEKILGIDIAYNGKSLSNCEAKLSNPHPIIVNKLQNSLVGPTSDIHLPSGVKEVRCRTELAIVIGKQAKNVSLVEAMECVFGYTVAQNITAVTFENGAINCKFQPILTSCADTFCPLGPSIVHHSLIPDPHSLMTQCNINGHNLQCDSTNGMMFHVDEIIHFISQFVSLSVGDVVLTGPPSGIGTYHRCAQMRLKEGDVVESEIENIGKLRNVVTRCKQ